MKTDLDTPKPIQEFQETSFKMAKAHGLDTVSCCILSYLNIQTKETTMDELARYTGYSLASISTATNTLIRMKAINKTKKPGSKKIYLSGHQSPIKMMEEQIKMITEGNLKDEINKLPQIIKDLKTIIRKENNKDKKQEYEKQLKLIETHEKEIKLMVHIMKITQREIEKVKRQNEK